MRNITETVVTIALAIVGLAMLATLVGKNARTSQVIDSGSKGFFTSLATAMGPVTGYTPPNAYGNSGLSNFGNFGSLF